MFTLREEQQKFDIQITTSCIIEKCMQKKLVIHLWFVIVPSAGCGNLLDTDSFFKHLSHFAIYKKKEKHEELSELSQSLLPVLGRGQHPGWCCQVCWVARRCCSCTCSTAWSPSHQECWTASSSPSLSYLRRGVNTATEREKRTAWVWSTYSRNGKWKDSIKNRSTANEELLSEFIFCFESSDRILEAACVWFFTSKVRCFIVCYECERSLVVKRLRNNKLQQVRNFIVTTLKCMFPQILQNYTTITWLLCIITAFSECTVYRVYVWFWSKRSTTQNRNNCLLNVTKCLE